MPKRLSIVIDTSIARAAGGPASEAPVGIQCRDFLQAVLKICHRFTMSPALYAEWKEHMSPAAVKWLNQMNGRRKIDRDIPDEDDVTTAEIANCMASDNQKYEMLKDLHLIVAASHSDKTVASLDKTTLALFRKHLPVVIGRFPHQWIDPTKDPTAVQRWLSEGGDIASATI